MAARVRVVIATYNRLPSLRLALRGYLRQTTRDFTLVVADDGSDDGTEGYVRAFTETAAQRGMCVQYEHQEDDGFRKARIVNSAVRRGSGDDLLIFTDSDCVPPANLIERHCALHEPHSFAVGGVVFLPEDVSAALTEADIDAGRHETLATPQDRRDLRLRARKSRWGMLFRRKNRPKVFGANLAVCARLFEAVNGFDEGFVGYGFEDDDLRDRMLRLRPRPAVRILHGKSDVFHLWHPRVKDRREPGRAYYRTSRPIVCEAGLRDLPRP